MNAMTPEELRKAQYLDDDDDVTITRYGGFLVPPEFARQLVVATKVWRFLRDIYGDQAPSADLYSQDWPSRFMRRLGFRNVGKVNLVDSFAALAWEK